MKYIFKNALMLAVTLLSLLFAGPGIAQTLNEEQKLLASDGAAGDHFGHSVAVDGATVLIGARGDDLIASGSAYVFTRSASVWTEQQKLTASDAAARDDFGISVDVDGDTAVIGAYQNDDDGSSSGSAYVFIRSAGVWSQRQKLLASDGAAFDFFGHSVAVDGATVLIGAHGNDDNGNSSGLVYVFTRNAGVWSEQQKLTASDAEASDWFGWSVDVDADTAVVGARSDDDDGIASGSAYVFTRNAGVWTEQQKLTASDAAAGDQFGFSVALDGATAVIGARWDDDNDSGSAYVFTRNAGVWSEQQKLTSSDTATSDNFAHSLDVDGDTVVSGAHFDDDDGVASGSAYVFTRSVGVWTEQQKLTASDAASGDQFGFSVAVDGNTAVIGAVADDDNGNASGSAYVFAPPRIILLRIFCIPTCEPFGQFGCDYIVFRCYIIPAIIIIIPIIIIGSFWFYRRRKRASVPRL